MKQDSKKINASVILFLSVLFFFCSNNLSAQSKPWIVPHDASIIKNPVQPDPASLKEGKATYVSYCTPCHGDKGKGDGAAAAALNPKPADHTSMALQNESDGSLFWKISEGRTPMPQYKAAFTEKQRWELVNFIRSLSKSTKR